ncbi:MAG: FmdB family transcriptional regulator [Chloroflexi bacterium]|nr:FmdB family transcriptional regulator [Chloroflexota bacterium]MBT5628186.1 FmdB family transcriptional regulator [Chloroflexota bacterium]
MPTYVYKCADNAHIFEIIQKFSDEPGADCPTCGSASKRQITAPTVIYKGSGFYTTDYGSGSSPGTKPNSSSSSSNSGSSDSDSGSSSSSSSSDSSGSSSSSDSSGGSSHSHGGASHSHGAGSHTH